MDRIVVEHQPAPEQLAALGIETWPTWAHASARFPWYYDQRETCYLLAGEVIVTPDGGEPVRIGEGDLVAFPAGLSCTWEIRRAVHKHYRFG